MDFEEIRNQLEDILSSLHPELRQVKIDEIMALMEYCYGKGRIDVHVEMGVITDNKARINQNRQNNEI